jgi:hypothetical protein
MQQLLRACSRKGCLIHRDGFHPNLPRQLEGAERIKGLSCLQARPHVRVRLRSCNMRTAAGPNEAIETAHLAPHVWRPKCSYPPMPVCGTASNAFRQSGDVRWANLQPPRAPTTWDKKSSSRPIEPRILYLKQNQSWALLLV